MKCFFKNLLCLLIWGFVMVGYCLVPGNGMLYAMPDTYHQTFGKQKLEWGFLDMIHGDGRLVINDMVFKVDSGTRYFYANGTCAELSAFSEHDNVMFSADENHVLEVLKIAKKAAPGVKRGSSSAQAGSRGGNRLYYKNGVWKNR